MMNGHDDDISPKALAALYREHDRFRDEQRAITEHEALTKRVDATTGLAYRDAPEIETADWSGWESWMGAHKAALKTEIEADVVKALDQEHDAVDKALVQSLEQVYHEIDHLEAENKELKGLLTAALGAVDKVREKNETDCRRQQASIVELKQFEAERRAREQVETERGRYIAELRRDVASVQVQLQNTEINAALAARDARIERLEMQLKMLLQFMSVSGVDLPRGGF